MDVPPLVNRPCCCSKDDDAEFLPRGMDVMGGGEDSFAAAKARWAPGCCSAVTAMPKS